MMKNKKNANFLHPLKNLKKFLKAHWNKKKFVKPKNNLIKVGSI